MRINFHDNRNNDPRSSFHRGSQAHSPQRRHMLRAGIPFELWKLTLAVVSIIIHSPIRHQCALSFPSIPITPPCARVRYRAAVSLCETEAASNGKNVPMKNLDCTKWLTLEKAHQITVCPVKGQWKETLKLKYSILWFSWMSFSS